MSRMVIAVMTANRPGTLKRCVSSMLASSGELRQAQWIVVDDSAPGSRTGNRELVRQWRSDGLSVAYIDGEVERRLAAAMAPDVRSAFERLTAKPPADRVQGARNLALLAGLAFEPELLFFTDDDMVSDQDTAGFYDWCLRNELEGSYIASPRKRGIRDMDYVKRLVAVLGRDDWRHFLTPNGLTAPAASWYTADNPLWKPEREAGEAGSVSRRSNVTTGLLVIRAAGVELLPFPGGVNEDLNWSILQASIHGTQLLKVHGTFAHHLPPVIGFRDPAAIIAEIVATGLMRALRELQPGGDTPLHELAPALRQAIAPELKKAVFPLLTLERAIRQRLQECIADDAPTSTLRRLESDLVGAKRQLGDFDVEGFVAGWLKDMEARRSLFSLVRRDVQAGASIRGLLAAGAVDV